MRQFTMNVSHMGFTPEGKPAIVYPDGRPLYNQQSDIDSVDFLPKREYADLILMDDELKQIASSLAYLPLVDIFRDPKQHGCSDALVRRLYYIFETRIILITTERNLELCAGWNITPDQLKEGRSEVINAFSKFLEQFDEGPIWEA